MRSESRLGVVVPTGCKTSIGANRLELNRWTGRALVADVLSLTRPQAAAKGLEISSIVDLDVPEALSGDAPRMRQVLLNIVSNAVKFTESGSVGIHVRRGASWSGGAAIECTIRDTGIGIAEARIASLFNEYVQGDCSINRRFGGTGLGLAICRRIIEAMGGTISILSTLGT